MRNEKETKLQQAQADLRAWERGHGNAAEKAGLLLKIARLKKMEARR